MERQNYPEGRNHHTFATPMEEQSLYNIVQNKKLTHANFTTAADKYILLCSANTYFFLKNYRKNFFRKIFSAFFFSN